jgi:hypothetical protein
MSGVVFLALWVARAGGGAGGEQAHLGEGFPARALGRGGGTFEAVLLPDGVLHLVHQPVLWGTLLRREARAPATAKRPQRP